MIFRRGPLEASVAPAVFPSYGGAVVALYAGDGERWGRTPGGLSKSACGPPESGVTCISGLKGKAPDRREPARQIVKCVAGRVGSTHHRLTKYKALLLQKSVGVPVIPVIRYRQSRFYETNRYLDTGPTRWDDGRRFRSTFWVQ